MINSNIISQYLPSHGAIVTSRRYTCTVDIRAGRMIAIILHDSIQFHNSEITATKYKLLLIVYRLAYNVTSYLVCIHGVVDFQLHSHDINYQTSICMIRDHNTCTYR